MVSTGSVIRPLSVLLLVLFSKLTICDQLTWDEDGGNFTYKLVAYYYGESGRVSCSTSQKTELTDYSDLFATYFEFGGTNANNWTNLELTFDFNLAYDLDGFSMYWKPDNAFAMNIIFTHSDGTSTHNISYQQEVVGSAIKFSAPSIDSSFEYAKDISLILEWDMNDVSGGIQVGGTDITARYATHEPTVLPTKNPSFPPTPLPSGIPSISPSPYPSLSPSSMPSNAPTQSPTFSGVYNFTDRTNYESWMNVYESWSSNVYELSTRDGMTYSNYSLPQTSSSTSRAYKLTALLAWSDIDASLEFMEDTDCYQLNITAEDIAYAVEWDPISSDITPPAWFNCTSVWLLKTSGRLAEWQDTYGRIEVWEVDSLDRYWLQWEFEFQWNDSYCTFDGDECSYLPLTDEENAAYFEFTMPKIDGDARVSPLIVVWYDILGVGYAVQPPLEYAYTNLTLENPEAAYDVDVSDLLLDLQAPLIAMGLLFGMFCAMICVSCALADQKKSKKDYMIDTRNLRTTFIHSPQSIIVPPDQIRNRGKFTCRRHGLWLFIVLFARLIYMFLFTLSMFATIFVLINGEAFSVLDTYDAKSDERNEQLLNLSEAIEVWYNNESEALTARVEFMQEKCLEDFINLTDSAWVSGALEQYDNHSTQMQYPLTILDFSLNVSSDLFLIGSSNPCDTSSTNGATVFTSNPLSTVTYFSNGTYQNQTVYYANEYNTQWSNFTILQTFLQESCESVDYCKGWSFTNSQSNTSSNGYIDASYALMAVMGDPKLDDTLSGVCYSTIEIDSDLLSLASSLSVDFFKNYTTSLEAEYLEAYVEDVATMYSQMQGMWTAIQSMEDNSGSTNHNFTVVINNDPTESDYDMSIDNEWLNVVTSGGELDGIYSNWAVVVSCPSCPEGNFTAPELQEIYSGLLSYNQSNITNYFNTSANVNISNLLDLSTALITTPDLPKIDVPLEFDLFDLPLGWILAVGLSIDILLFIYRWYRTAGIVARIIRGKDVEIALAHLMVEHTRPTCCQGHNCADKVLACVMYCHDWIFYLNYNLWKLFYWMWLLLRVLLLGVVIYVLYMLADQILSVQFFEDLGVFDLMSIALAAQRLLRNQVLSTSAIAYNKITLSNMQSSMETQAQTKNDAALTRNTEELDRVDEWNFYFGQMWETYQGTDREITDLEYILSVYPSNPYTIDTAISVLFDDTNTASWIPYSDADQWSDTANVSTMIEITLPSIYMTNYLNVYWQITEIQFNWNWMLNNSGNVSATDYIAFSFATLAEDDSVWIEEINGASTYTYTANTYSVTNDEQPITITWNSTTTYKLRITFANVGTWRDAFSLNSISLWGHAPYSLIDYPAVEFQYWSYDASSYQEQLLYCPEVTPVFGIMYRGFVRDWITQQLLEFHEPYILAIRQICLSPFYIVFVAIIILFFAYLLTFMMEWTLKRVNLYRENRFARVQLVTVNANYDNYNPTLHEIVPDVNYDFEGNVEIQKTLLTLTNLTADDSIERPKDIEMALAAGIRIPKSKDGNTTHNGTTTTVPRHETVETREESDDGGIVVDTIVNHYTSPPPNPGYEADTVQSQSSFKNTVQFVT